MTSTFVHALWVCLQAPAGGSLDGASIFGADAEWRVNEFQQLLLAEEQDGLGWLGVRCVQSKIQTLPFDTIALAILHISSR